MTDKLPREFYLQDTIEVARQLLGKVLVRVLPDGRRLSGIIVETEAYLGGEDPAAHSFGLRRTTRTETMFLEGGHAYVYFIYGMYNCFNIVVGEAGRPEAVLIRALEPYEGLAEMRRRRPVRKDIDLTNGPGKLCLALAIDRQLNAKSLLGDEIFVAEFPSEITMNPELTMTPVPAIVEDFRIGIDYSGDAAFWPLRFLIEANPYVSRPAEMLPS